MYGKRKRHKVEKIEKKILGGRELGTTIMLRLSKKGREVLGISMGQKYVHYFVEKSREVLKA